MTGRSSIGGTITLVTPDELGPVIEASDGVEPRKDDPDPPTDPNLKPTWTFANPVTAVGHLPPNRLVIACGRQVFIVKVF
jgi:hypothetical protein